MSKTIKTGTNRRHVLLFKTTGKVQKVTLQTGRNKERKKERKKEQDKKDIIKRNLTLTHT